jgi:hypothetical protein
LTINAPDCNPKDVEVNIEANRVYFKGPSKSKTYVVDMELYAEIDPTLSKKHISPRGVDFVLSKKELKSEFWPRLLKDSKKQHYLKTDFDKVCLFPSLSIRAMCLSLCSCSGYMGSGSMRMSKRKYPWEHL